MFDDIPGARKMMDHVLRFPEMFKESLLYSYEKYSYEDVKGERVIFFGMGGSGIGGLVIASLMEFLAPSQYIVLENPHLPRWVSREDLVVAVTYSGNTRETLDIINQAISKDVKVAILSSGGKAAEIARKESVPFIRLVPGYQPRSAFPAIVGSLISLLSDLPGGEILAGWGKGSISPLEEYVKVFFEWEEEPPRLVEKIGRGKFVPVFMGGGPFYPVAVRAASQFNENAKIHAFWSRIPEMGHNQITAWDEQAEKRFLPVVIKGSDKCKRLVGGLSIYEKGIIDFLKSVGDLVVLEHTGMNPLEEVLLNVLTVDAASIFVAMERGVDPVVIEGIHRLKNLLENMDI
ncbi:MAG: SIS domain-containing protein [Thermoplasmata archaeon]|nr:SIS domain-containing protein [Thermoplasmata archaeon]